MVAVLCVLPLVAAGQQSDSTSLPWTLGLTAGANIWPTSKEKLRMGISWEAARNTYLLHELAYVNAVKNFLETDERFGILEGGQLRNELRFFPATDRWSRFYYGPSLAYMFTRHRYTSVTGMECEPTGDCAYWRRNERAVAAHSATLGVVGGLLVPTGKVFHFNFHLGAGLRGTYFPTGRTEAYFGQQHSFSKSENFVLEPNLRLGVILLFALKQRNKEGGLQKN